MAPARTARAAMRDSAVLHRLVRINPPRFMVRCDFCRTGISMGPMAIAIISLLLGAGFGCALAYLIARDKLRAQYDARLSVALAETASSQSALASVKAQAQQAQAETGELRAR